MSDIIPYISTEPPPLLPGDGGEVRNSNDISSSTAININQKVNNYKHNYDDKINNDIDEVTSVHTNESKCISDERQPGVMSTIELVAHLDSVVAQHGVCYDEPDGLRARDYVSDEEEDRLSQMSEPGQFDDELDEMFSEPMQNMHPIKQNVKLNVHADAEAMDCTDFVACPATDETDMTQESIENTRSSQECDFEAFPTHLNVEKELKSSKESLQSKDDIEFSDFAICPTNSNDVKESTSFKESPEIDLNDGNKLEHAEDVIDFTEFAAFPVHPNDEKILESSKESPKINADTKESNKIDLNNATDIKSSQESLHSKDEINFTDFAAFPAQLNEEKELESSNEGPNINQDTKESVEIDLNIENKDEIDFAAFPSHTNDQTESNFNHIQSKNRDGDDDIEFADFAAFPTQESSNKSDETEIPNHTLNKDKDDDDFDDFADFTTFQTPVTPISQPSVPIIDEQKLLETLKIQLKETVSEIPGDTFSKLNVSDESEVEFNHFSDDNYEVWKELSNFDFSPAFQFQWLQSAIYDKFVDSLGPEYRRLINSQRAALPIFTSNLNPLEPIPASEMVPSKPPVTAHSKPKSSASIVSDSSQSSLSSQNKPHPPIVTNPQCDSVSNNSNISASSQLDLHTVNAPVSGQFNTLSIKNLEDEFIFSTPAQPAAEVPHNFSSLDDTMTITPPPSQEPITERIFRNLKIRSMATSQSTSPVIRPQTKAVLAKLPDLSYMNSTVLMFPILSATSNDKSQQNDDGIHGKRDIFPGDQCISVSDTNTFPTSHFNA